MLSWKEKKLIVKEGRLMERIGNNGITSSFNAPPAQAAPAEHSPVPRDRIELSPEKERTILNDPAALRETISRLPKVDIHRHLEGAIKPQTILRIAEKYGIDLPAKTVEGLTPFVCVNENDKTLGDFLKKFSILGKLWVDTDAIKEISRQCVLDAKEENVRAMELRFSPHSMSKAGNLTMKQVVDAVIEGVREGEKETGIIVGLTTIIPRQKDYDQAKEIEDLTEEYVKNGAMALEAEADAGKDPLKQGFSKVTAIDLACDEAKYPPEPHAPIFLESEREGIHRTLHAGEARGADSVRSALHDCHAERIGHGIRSFEDPELVQELVLREIPLEMCPTSNEQTGAIDTLEHHPLKKFYDMGGKATINTDDPGVCGTDLNKEYLVAIRRIGCTLEDVENMILFGVDALFLPAPIKAALHASMAGEIRAINETIEPR
jgi:adenosine deaminase